VNRIARLIDHRARALIAVLVPVAFHGARREGIVEIIRHDLAGRKVELDLGPILGGEIGKAPVEQGFGGRNKLDDDAVVGGQRILDGGKQRGQFHRQQKLAEEALLRAFEARARRRQRLTIEGLAFERIGDARCAKRRLKVAVDDRLSRGSDNAQERGVVAEFPLSGANLLRIILVANLGGLWTNRGDNHVEVAR
jgi:hypothetical protein